VSVLRPFVEARIVLGVSVDDDAAAIKRAYRKLALAHPPDMDPDGFRRVRDAYELLTEPSARVRELLLRPLPAVDPPPLPTIPELPRAAALPIAILRLAAASVDAAALLETTTAEAADPEREPMP
jgi:hypothetical protein